MLMNRNLTFGVTLFTVVYIIFCGYYFHDFVFALPYGLHDEAQADRLAVAIQYFDRGMDFFHPRTYHLYATDGITPIEFPVHPYLAAILGHIFGREHISLCYRLLTLCIGYVGLLSLFLTVARATKDIVSAMFMPFFLLSSPVFAYYLCNYMPDAAATCISFSGFYLFLKYIDNRRFKTYVWAIVVLTLAALIKTSVAVILLSVIGYSVIDMLFIKRLGLGDKLWKVLLTYGLSLGAILAYYLYNQHLTDKYHGYIFLMRVLPFENKTEVRTYFEHALPVRYINEYFTVAHYPIMAFIVAAGVFTLFKNKAKRQLLILIGIMMCGCASLLALFGHQLIHHDYYFVSMFIPSIIIILTILLIEIRNRIPRDISHMANVGLIAALCFVCLYGKSHFFKRINMDEHKYPGTKENDLSYWMKGGDRLLDKLGIDEDSSIFILDENPANVGLVYFDRKGMNAMKQSWGSMYDVRNYMNSRDIKIMVCDARKLPWFESFGGFSKLFTEIYRDERRAVYYLMD